MKALLVTLIVALALPAVASAHATLRSTTPSFGRELQRGPGSIHLLFDQHVNALPGAVHVLNGVGRDFAVGSGVQGDELIAGVRPLKVGTRMALAPSASARSHAAFDIAQPILGSSEASGSWWR